MIAATFGAGGHSNNPLDETLVPSVAATLSGHQSAPGRHQEDDSNLVVGSTIDEGQARPLVARSTGYRMDLESENFVVADPVSAHEGKTYTHEGKNNFRTHNLVDGFYAHRGQANDTAYTEDGSPPLADSRAPGINGPMGVRRLTPLECERLQGWPDEHTRYTADGKEIPDSHRYRMIGNGVVATVAEWIGHRLVWVGS